MRLIVPPSHEPLPELIEAVGGAERVGAAVAEVGVQVGHVRLAGVDDRVVEVHVREGAAQAKGAGIALARKDGVGRGDGARRPHRCARRSGQACRRVVPDGSTRSVARPTKGAGILATSTVIASAAGAGAGAGAGGLKVGAGGGADVADAGLIAVGDPSDGVVTAAVTSISQSLFVLLSRRPKNASVQTPRPDILFNAHSPWLP